MTYRREKKTEIIKLETDGSRIKIDNRSDLFSFTNIKYCSKAIANRKCNLDD
jgi:hypothetical protein